MASIKVDPTPVDRVGAVGEVVAHYQPVFDLSTNEMVGAEALVRMDGPEADAVPALRVLGAARALGIEARLTDVMLAQACVDFASGAAAENGWWVSVNLGRGDVVDRDLPGRVAGPLEATGLDPSRLVLEVPETIAPCPEAADTLRAVAAMGVRIALDDFGAVTSTVEQVTHLPIDIVKLDRSIVQRSTYGGHARLKAAVGFARSRGLVTIAEGIEQWEDKLLATLADCDLGQGFHWSSAKPRDELFVEHGCR